MGFKLMALLTIGNEVPVGPEAILQTVSLFAFDDFFLLFILIITPHILDVHSCRPFGCPEVFTVGN